MSLTTLIILAITVEALIAYGVAIFGKTIDWKQIVAIVIAVFLAFAAGIDLYPIVGVSFQIPFVGIVLTGIIFSRGANYTSDLLKTFQSMTASNKAITAITTDTEE